MTSAELVWRNAKTNFNGKVVKGHERKVFRSRRYKQFGNAVTVNVSKAVAQSVKTTLINLGEWKD